MFSLHKYVFRARPMESLLSGPIRYSFSYLRDGTHTHTHTHTVARGFEKREPLLQASQRLLNVIHSGGEGGWASVSREVLIPN